MWRAAIQLERLDSVAFRGGRRRRPLGKRKRSQARKKKIAHKSALEAARQVIEAVEFIPDSEWLEAMLDHLESSPPPPDDHMDALWADIQGDIASGLLLGGEEDDDVQVDLGEMWQMAVNGEAASPRFTQLGERIRSRLSDASPPSVRRLAF